MGKRINDMLILYRLEYEIICKYSSYSIYKTILDYILLNIIYHGQFVTSIINSNHNTWMDFY